MQYNILDYQAVGDGSTKCTAAIQAAIDDCAAAQGGQVVIPAGRYLSGSLRLRSNVDLHLSSGAVLISSLAEEDMIDFSKEFTDDNEDTGWEGGCFLYACHEKNITISGAGTIDGQGRLVFYDDDTDEGKHECPLNVRGFRPRMSFLEDVENLTVTGVTFRDSAFWTLHLAGCRNVLIENIRILNDERGPNNDGIDPDCCQNVIIRGCIIEGGDDSVVVKTTLPMTQKYGSCSNIVVSGCIMHSRSSALKIGTETHGDIHDIIMADCILRDCTRGIGIWSRDGGEIYNIHMHHVTGNTRSFANCSSREGGVNSWWGDGEPVFLSATKREGVDRLPGRIRDITMDHLNLKAEGALMLAGEDYAPVEHVQIRDTVIRFSRQSRELPEYLDERPSARGRVQRQIPCIYQRCTRDVSIEAELIVEENMKEFIRTREICE